MKMAHAHPVAAVVSGTTLAWAGALQDINLILGLLASLVGFLVGCHALYFIVRAWFKKL